MTTKNPAAVALGSIKSPAKAAAARENGKKGGRPKKIEQFEKGQDNHTSGATHWLTYKGINYLHTASTPDDKYTYPEYTAYITGTRPDGEVHTLHGKSIRAIKIAITKYLSTK